jgi:hypothetical protein
VDRAEGKDDGSTGILRCSMRWIIDHIVGMEESVLDAAIDGLLTILGASLLTLVLHVIIEAL